MKWFRRAPPDPAIQAARMRALQTLTRVLEAAKEARDRGADVRADRETLKQARAAFEAGDYARAEAYAEELLRHYAARPPSAP